MKQQFKVAAGRHTQDGQTYNKGEIVVSDHNLSALFPGKFTVVTAPVAVVEEAPAPPPQSTTSPATAKVEERPVESDKAPVQDQPEGGTVGQRAKKPSGRSAKKPPVDEKDLD